jgi:hypothetical protein
MILSKNYFFQSIEIKKNIRIQGPVSLWISQQTLQPHWPYQPLKPYFLKKNPDTDGWNIPGTKRTNTGPFLWNGSSKIQFFTDIWYSFCQRLLRVQPMILFWKTCWWNSNVRKSECQNHLQTKYNLHNSIRQIQITFLLIFLVISNLLWQFSTHLLRCEENYFFLLVFPVLSSRDSVLKRSQIIGLRPPTCTTFSQKCSCSQELGKQVTHTKKNFSHSKSRQL